MSKEYDLDAVIRKVPDFPKPGILFYDITGVLVNPEAFRYCVDTMIKMYRDSGIEGIAGIDARGFVFAAPLAYELQIPLILVRKKGKLPGEKHVNRFTLEYGEDQIEIHRADLHPPRRVLIVDDLIATGGTLKATAEILEAAGSTVAGIFSVVALPFLDFDKKLAGYDIRYLQEYHSE